MDALAFAALKGAARTLYKVIKKHKDAKNELQEVEFFLQDLEANSPILNATYDSSKGLNQVKNTLRGKLKSARKLVKELSRRDWTDFLHSDERLRKIQGVRQMVKVAMDTAHTQWLVCMSESQHEFQDGNREAMDEVRKLLRNLAKDAAVPDKKAKPNVQHPKPKPNVQHPKPEPNVQHPKPGAQGIPKTSPPGSKSTPGTVASKAPPSTSRRDKKVELYVPMDSEKQARDVVEKLKALPGVENAISDQPSKKVTVVPRKGHTLNTDQLLRDARLENKYVAPTLWSKRPR